MAAAQGHTQKRKHIGSSTLAMSAVVALLVTLLLGIGGTLCALADSVKHDGNEGYLDARLVQTYGEKLITDVYPGFSDTRTAQATNIGTEDMYVRMRINKFWADRDTRSGGYETQSDKVDSNDAKGTNGADLTPTSDTVDNDLIVVNLDDTEKWVDGGDGWYYYTDIIAPGETSTSLLASVGISEKLGEEQNNNQSTDVKYGGIDSKYLTKAAVLDVDLEAVTTHAEEPKPEPEPEPEPDNPDTTPDTGKDSSDKTSYVTPAKAKSAFIAKTGDGLSPLVMTLFALALVAFLVCIFLFLAAKHRRSDEEQEEEVTVMNC